MFVLAKDFVLSLFFISLSTSPSPPAICLDLIWQFSAHTAITSILAISSAQDVPFISHQQLATFYLLRKVYCPVPARTRVNFCSRQHG